MYLLNQAQISMCKVEAQLEDVAQSVATTATTHDTQSALDASEPTAQDDVHEPSAQEHVEDQEIQGDTQGALFLQAPVSEEAPSSQATASEPSVQGAPQVSIDEEATACGEPSVQDAPQVSIDGKQQQQLRNLKT